MRLLGGRRQRVMLGGVAMVVLGGAVALAGLVAVLGAVFGLF